MRWQNVRSGYDTVAPDERQQRLAGEATKLLFPDFTLDELYVNPGSYDAVNHTYDFDYYVTRLHLTADPSVRLVALYDVASAAADEAKLAREDVNLDTGDALEQLEGTTWLIYITDSKKPLVGGIKDQAYVGLMQKAEADWSAGEVARVVPASDGSVTVRMFTWESYWKSEASDYVDAVYRNSAGAWTLESYDIVIGSREGTQTGAGTTGITG